MISPIQTIAIVGLGNVGSQLAKAFDNLAIPIQQIYNRNQAIAEALANEINAQAVTSLSEIKTDLCIIAVADDAIETVIHQIPKSVKIAYTSGGVKLQDLERKENIGVFYPLQSFSKGRTINLFEVPFFIEATDIDFAQQLFDLAWKISRKVQFVDSKQRRKIHLAAVFINNFVNHQIYIAEKLATTYKFDKALLYPLLRETIEKAIENGAYDSQTGPAKRNDKSVIEAQTNLLSGRDKAIYELITKSIIETYHEKL